jgi:ribonuclease P protein component
MRQDFSKAERLYSKKVINQLFEKGSDKTQAVFLYPFRVVYLLKNTEAINQLNENKPVSIIISVTKRSFKKAIDRNLIKRRTREAYRINKKYIYENNCQHMISSIAFIYVGKEITPYSLIETKIIEIMQKIVSSCLNKFLK